MFFLSHLRDLCKKAPHKNAHKHDNEIAALWCGQSDLLGTRAHGRHPCLVRNGSNRSFKQVSSYVTDVTRFVAICRDGPRSPLQADLLMPAAGEGCSGCSVLPPFFSRIETS